jgi:hypothetical protein
METNGILSEGNLLCLFLRKPTTVRCEYSLTMIESLKSVLDGDLEKLKDLIKQKSKEAIFAERDTQGFTLLHWAIVHPSSAIAMFLISEGFSLDDNNNVYKQTPLVLKIIYSQLTKKLALGLRKIKSGFGSRAQPKINIYDQYGRCSWAQFNALLNPGRYYIMRWLIRRKCFNFLFVASTIA